MNKNSWWSSTSFATIWSPSWLQIRSCRHQLGLFCLLGGKCSRRKVKDNVNHPSALWGNLDTKAGFYVVWCCNLQGKKKDQHIPPSIYLILKIIFHWVWLASAWAVTHTGIQTKAALALSQWAGAGWSMSVLSSEKLLVAFRPALGWEDDVFIYLLEMF